MRRGWLALGGGLGLSALWRRFQHRPHGAPENDPAAELRAKLAESRAGGAATVEAPAAPVPEPAEPVAEPEAATPLDPEVRRRSLHERARASIEELGSDGD